MITSTASAAWTSNAPCAGVTEYVLPDEKLLRDRKQLVELAGPLMRGCAEQCTFVAACYERVRPKEGFDGVCAARLWVNGRLVAVAESAPELSKPPSLAGICGDRTGRRKHRELGEPLCGECRASELRALSRRAGRANIRNFSGHDEELAAA